MKLVVGLGNPGRKYAETRHNVGFLVVAELARRFNAPLSRRKFDGEYSEIQIAGERVLLLCPQTFMNRSGASVLAARDFYKINDDEILIICDDFSLPLGRLRFRPKGSAGGQKGLDNVIQRLGNQEIPRLRIGIDPPPENWDVADYVLSKFRQDEVKSMDIAIQLAADAVETWTRAGINACFESIQRFLTSVLGGQTGTDTAKSQGRTVLATNFYECLIILDSNRYARDPQGVSATVPEMIEKSSGEVLANRLWNEQKLAYQINGHRKGTYWLSYFRMESSKLTGFNRACQLNDHVLRHMVTKVDPRLVDILVAHARGEKTDEPAESSPEPSPATEAVAATTETAPELQDAASVAAATDE